MSTMGDLPDGWTMVPLEEVAVVNPRKSVDLPPLQPCYVRPYGGSK